MIQGLVHRDKDHLDLNVEDFIEDVKKNILVCILLMNNDGIRIDYGEEGKRKVWVSYAMYSYCIVHCHGC